MRPWGPDNILLDTSDSTVIRPVVVIKKEALVDDKSTPDGESRRGTFLYGYICPNDPGWVRWAPLWAGRVPFSQRIGQIRR